MESYKKLLPIALFGLFFLKVLILPFSYPEVAILAVLGAVVCYLEYKQNDEKLKALEVKIEASVKSLEDRVRQIDDLKGAINSLKLSAISRPMSQAGGR